MKTLEKGKLLVASHNQGKIKEMIDLLGPFGFEVVSAGDLGLPEPDETGTTFEENAYIKAFAAAKATGLVALSDDSGLCVDALGGNPGVYTANWAELPDGKRDFSHGMQKVEAELQQAGANAPENRSGRFVSVICLAWPDGEANYYRGEVEGEIVWPPRGTAGFGYRPGVQAGRPRRDVRRNDGRTKAWLEAWRQGRAVASRARLPAFCQRLSGRRMNQSDRGESGFGVYVHWPFCMAKCPYCDFNSHVRHQTVDQPRFAAAFAREMATMRTRTGQRTVSSIFLGGGTPSLMQPETVASVLNEISRNWHVPDDIEITLEANPTSVEADRFRGYRAAGVNRVSLGVQALNDADLRRLGRMHNVKEALAAIKLAREIFPGSRST